jgi:hypothetical protein
MLLGAFRFVSDVPLVPEDSVVEGDKLLDKDCGDRRGVNVVRALRE